MPGSFYPLPAQEHCRFRLNAALRGLLVTTPTFRALLLTRPADENVSAIVELDEDALPAGDVLVNVKYSTVNYKDGMAISGSAHRQVVQFFPFVPGVDFSGVVEHSDSPEFKPGDEVILNGWGVGEKHWGGFSEKARVRAEWLVHLPEGMSLRQAMSHGSAGLSAMLCINALERHGIDKSKKVLVTGASGGVGSVAVMLLAKLGYHTVASSGRPEHEGYLRALGATEIIDRKSLAVLADPPLMDERWGAVIDNVGGSTLSNALASMCYGGAIASLGLVGGRDLITTVLPFIMRAVTLIGVNSVYCSKADRVAAWARLAELLPDGLPGDVVEEIGLEQVPERALAVVRGEVRGRTIVAL
jgi:acrylyl-CoA reductase (NADPH)